MRARRMSCSSNPETMKQRAILIFSLLALIVALPLVMRRKSETVSPMSAQDIIVILTPHNESIRYEFGEAFARWWREKTGRSLYVDWRTPGGTSELRMVLDAGFKAAKETDRKGIGMDVFFGGGAPDFIGQAKQGRLMPLDVFTKHPEWFGPDAPIPPTFTGETFYPPDKTWVGTCASQFGICYNPDVLARLGLPAPKTWADLTDPRYAGNIALADPTKSGSVARAFELIVQSEILRAGGNAANPAALQTGWENGLRLIQRMAANARYFTDSASKIPQDVGQGNAAAGMCIDFYGRSFASELTTKDGRSRLIWIAPEGGTTLSADPVGVLKGAPHPALAQAFVEFCLLPETQILWSAKPGTPGGPVSRALHRTPIRRDCYTPEILARSTMPENLPYQDKANFTYDPALTGKAFNTLRQLVKAMCIDSHEEMKSSWAAMKHAGMPAAALAKFSDVSILTYAQGGKGDPRFDGSDALKTAANSAHIGAWFRANYEMAEEMADRNGNQQ